MLLNVNMLPKAEIGSLAGCFAGQASGGGSAAGAALPVVLIYLLYLQIVVAVVGSCFFSFLTYVTVTFMGV